jgi:hypothetical protein
VAKGHSGQQRFEALHVLRLHLAPCVRSVAGPR